MYFPIFLFLYIYFFLISFFLVFRFLESDSEGDADWLSQEYNSIYEKRSRKRQFSNVGQDKVCLSESESTDSSSDSEQLEERYDNEDLEFNSFILPSTEEDNLLENFTEWLMSIDGGKRPARQAQKHKRIVMSIVRHNNDEEIKYQNLACPSFLNSWMTKLTEEKKEAATIKTYLCSVKHFLDFAVATGNNILGSTNLKFVYCFGNGAILFIEKYKKILMRSK